MATFGRYEILERIASGGMAEVYRARAWGAGDFAKDVVIKKILPNYSADPEFRSLFIQEARISVGLTHSRIVQVLDFGIMEGSYFIALELVDGPNLGDLLIALRRAKAPMPIAATVHVITEALSGLDYAHRRTGGDGKPMEIVHRDVSPTNVLLSFGGEVKIGDFGIARAAGSPSLTRVGRVRGKPAYMSPEQIRGRPLDARSDLFSAGLLFYEMLTGFPAYGGLDDNAIMNAILDGDLAPPSSRAHDLPRTFDPLLKRALNLDEDQRYSSAAEMRQAILDVAYLERIRPDPDVLSALVKKHIPRGARSVEQSRPSAVLERTGADGELGRFDTTGTAESERGPKAGTPVEPTTAESTRGSVHTPATLDPPQKPTRVLPPKPATGEETNIAPPPKAPPAEEASATDIRIPRSPDLRGTVPPEPSRPSAGFEELPTTRRPPPRDDANPIPRLVAGLAVGLAVVAVGYLAVPHLESRPPRTTPAPTRATPVLAPMPTLAVITLEEMTPTPAPPVSATPAATPSAIAVKTAPAATPSAIAVKTAPAVTPKPASTPLGSLLTAATPTPTKRPARATGTLSLTSKPWGEVAIDGKSAGPTPIVDYVLPAGTHNVVITGAGGVSATFTVTIEAGKPTRKSVELK